MLNAITNFPFLIQYIISSKVFPLEFQRKISRYMANQEA